MLERGCRTAWSRNGETPVLLVTTCARLGRSSKSFEAERQMLQADATLCRARQRTRPRAIWR